MQSLISFFGANEFVPHGYCLTWSLELLWLHVLSDALIVLSYYSIPITLIYFVRQRKDLPYPGLFLIFGLFIVACGTSHLLSVITIWIPLYWLDGMLKAITAAVSVCAAFMTYWIVPRALQLRSPTQLEADIRDKSRKLVATIAELKETEAALQVSEQRLKLAVASGRVGIWDYHLQSDELIWDDTMFALYGVRREAFSGKYEDWSSRLHPDDKLPTEKALQAAIAGIRHYDPEFRVIWPNGEVRYIKGHASVIRDESGKPVRMIGTNWDNFEHAATLHKLQLAHAAINHSKSSYFWFNRQGEVVDVNDYACHSLGYGRDELIGRKLWEFDSDYPAESWHGDWLENRKKGVHTFESRHRRKDGSVFPVETTTNYLAVDNEEYGFSFTLDISERKQAEQAIQESRSQLRTMIRTIPDLIWLKNTQGVYLFCNSRFEDYFGAAERDIVGKTDYDFLSKEVADAFLENDRLAMMKDKPNSYERWFTFASDGHKELLEVTNTPLLDAEGNNIGALGIGRDITERKRAEENLRLIASVFDNSQEAILIADKNNNIVDVNPAFSQITGYSRDEVLGRNPKFLSSGRQDNAFYRAMWYALSENGVWRGEIWNRRKSGEVYAELLSVSAIRDDKGSAHLYVGIFSDISYLKEHEAELSRVAHYDALTGVPNRLLLADRIKLAIAQAAREHQTVAVCYLDLDGFKTINDSMGHEAGDQVLIEVARRIEHTLRGGDTVARLGGDEFVVLLRLDKDHECIASLERLLAVIAHPIGVNGESHSIGASIGVSLYPQDNGDADTLLRHADQAMYVAKQSGKNSFYIYDPALDLRTRNHQEFLKCLSEALACNQFEMVYQPKIHLRTGHLVGVEALIRWRHPERGVLSPLEFLRQIENTGLDIEIGNWVISTTLAQIHAWHSHDFAVEVSINISAYHLESPGFADYLREQMALFEIPPGRLQIEVLETAALTDMAVVREIIEECRAFGVGFALDDFGTGYSSLSYLSRLPVDVLKIDQSFVRDMLEDNGDKTIVQGIIALARAFGREIVAEGIETDEHGGALLEMGCEIGQGYGIARPMDVEQLKRWHEARIEKISCVDMV